MGTVTRIVALGAALFMTNPAFAQSAVAKACAPDIKGNGRTSSLRRRGQGLTWRRISLTCPPTCQAAIVRAAAVGKACKADVKPGKGGHRGLMKTHLADVSDGCKDAMANAKAGNQ
jgi:hypothetical protein